MTTVAIAPLYLSRLLLDPRSRQVMSELAHPYEMHRTLMRAFPRATEDTKSRVRDEFGVLFRGEVDELQSVVKVYVQSLIEPDWSFLTSLNHYLLDLTGSANLACKNITDSYRSLQDGQILAFRLRANPTKRILKVIKGDTDLKGKRVGLLREEEQIAWLVRKAQEREPGQPGGFELLTRETEYRDGSTRQVPRVIVEREGKQMGWKRESGRSCQTTHLAVTFDGLLRITNTDAFWRTLASGIGSAKAFGFGLLSVARA